MKTHLLVSENPLHFLSGGEMIALCHARVRNPQPVLMVEVGQRGLPTFSSLRDCSKCINLAIDEFGEYLGKRYLYGVVEGEEAIHQPQSVFDDLDRLVNRYVPIEDDGA